MQIEGSPRILYKYEEGKIHQFLFKRLVLRNGKFVTANDTGTYDLL